MSEGAVKALSEDAQAFGRPFTECLNCAGPLPENFAVVSRSERRMHGGHARKLCAECGGIAEALAIGNPRTSAAFLYDDNKGNAQAWTGPVMGQIVHRSTPERFRLGAVRYRVRMLDGSMWHGTGPTANGNYIRLRRMKRGA